MAQESRPIVIKRIKKIAAAHHGGAWKIAYADFVTAMMAFFLLMWLLGSTAKGDLNGIADYFKTPLKVALMGGSGSGDSTTITRGGGQDLSRSAGQVKRGDKLPDRQNKDQAAKWQGARDEAAKIAQLKERFASVLDGNPRLAAVRDQIRLELTTEGLRIQIVDDKNRPMFDTGSARLKDYTREILHEVAKVLNGAENKIALSGHTDATPYSGGERGYSNWELSADRANASRRELIAAGLADDKVLRVVGLAASMPLGRDDPFDASNRRISILVLNHEAEAAFRSAGEPINPAPAAAPAATAQPAPARH